MTAPTIDRARPYMAALADQLTAAGATRSRRWDDAFSSVPRHLFVPRWYEQETTERGIAVWRERQAITDADLTAVYRDQTLVTALDPATAEQVDDTAWTGIPTSSSTLPSLMAGMLEDLAVEDGMRVLEIGTGTGYNAALLSCRLGEHLVYSVDVDPALVETARQRLAEAGHVPQLAVGDGSHGHPAECTFDRIIATCSVPALPAAWLGQSGPGTVVLTDVDLGVEGGLVRLTVDNQGRALGRFTGTSGRFMAARTDAAGYAPPQRTERAPAVETRRTTVTAADLRANYPFRLLLAFHLPSTQLVYHVDDAGTMALQLQRADGSWARAPLTADGPATVTYGGDPGLWREVEAAWRWWTHAGRPAQDQFAYVLEADGRVHVRHIPDGARWDLPARA
ncbi:methyltransferase domain-containing protein [Streptomyces sp. B15]|uniref:methyltransferase domain-containing protein n=1 Tax=Streptomyces sp. B15 TaxID=1537797 RepID=UPI0027DDA1B9|nr:methyltransferase domain-containing protein [Streptomyces sp. B15]